RKSGVLGLPHLQGEGVGAVLVSLAALRAARRTVRDRLWKSQMAKAFSAPPFRRRSSALDGWEELDPWRIGQMRRSSRLYPAVQTKCYSISYGPHLHTTT